MAEIKKMVPKRRFKEFQDAEAWEERKLSELAKISTGFPFDSKDFDQNGNYLVITNGNIQNDSPTVDGHIGNRIKIESPDSRQEYILKKYDILVTMDGTVGRTAKVIEDQQILAQRVGRLTAKDNHEFVYQYLNTGAFFDEMTLVSHGGTIKHISLNEIGNYKNFVPYIDEEVKKIGIFFQNLDRQITLQQRKLEKIKAMKKAYLFEMFPAAGQTKPKRRFKGFTEDWVEKKLGELCIEFRSGEFIRASDIAPEGEYPVYGGNGLRGYASSYTHDGEYALIGRQGALCGNMQFSNGMAYFTEHAIAIKANYENETRFLYHLLGAMNLGQYSGQSAQPGLAVGKLIEIITLVPMKAEQKKIGNFFSDLDKQITLHQKKLSKLQNLKKAYLNEMFI